MKRRVEQAHVLNDKDFKSIGSFKRLRENEIRAKEKKKLKNRNKRK